jgi:hypothetical protein
MAVKKRMGIQGKGWAFSGMIETISPVKRSQWQIPYSL